MADVEVRRGDLRATRLTGGEARAEGPLADGEAQLRVERFALTANNVTYGVMGDALSYWRFFPASEEGWGRVPVWGVGEVVASAAAGVEAGERFYGYFPMSTYVTMRPRAGGPGFLDGAEHRRELPRVYNQYLRLPADAERLEEMLLLRPLFSTSWLLAQYLGEHDAFGADAVVLGSASSKTAYGLASLLDGPRVIGLTSPGNRAFVESLGLYDGVLAYDEAEALAGDEKLVFVDMAGDAAVREAVHRVAGDRLQRSIQVGATHWERLEGAGELAGPAPEFFFAPTYMEQLGERLGPGEMHRRLGEAWTGFVERVGAWMDIERGEGGEAVQRVWRALVDGEADPRRGHILSLP